MISKMISVNNDKQDDQLKVIIDNVKKELLAMLPTIEDNVPEEIEFIIVEVATKRYNRIGAEGMSTESVDGRTNTFINGDFDEYFRGLFSRFAFHCHQSPKENVVRA